MTVGLEPIAAQEFLYGTLSGDTELQGLLPGGWHDGAAPPETLTPWGEFTPFTPGEAARGVGLITVLVNSLWIVKAVHQGADYGPIAAAAHRINELIGGVTNVEVTDGTVLACVRVEIVQRADVEGGQEYRHLGGIYRLQVQ